MSKWVLGAAQFGLDSHCDADEGFAVRVTLPRDTDRVISISQPRISGCSAIVTWKMDHAHSGGQECLGSVNVRATL